MSLTEQQVDEMEKQWDKQKKLIKREEKIKNEMKTIKGKKFSTTKIIMFFLFLNCTVIEIFTGWVTMQSIRLAEILCTSPDFTPLITLIGTVVGEVIGFCVYAMKSLKENQEGGITYMTAKRDAEQEQEIFNSIIKENEVTESFDEIDEPDETGSVG